MTLPVEKNGSRCTKQPNYTKRKSGGAQVVEGIWVVGKGWRLEQMHGKAP